jgi:hypothetical protein
MSCVTSDGHPQKLVNGKLARYHKIVGRLTCIITMITDTDPDASCKLLLTCVQHNLFAQVQPHLSPMCFVLQSTRGHWQANDSAAYQHITRSSLLAAAAQQLRLDCLMVCCALLVGMSTHNLKTGAK